MTGVRTGHTRPAGVDRTGDPILGRMMDPAVLAAVMNIVWYSHYLTGYNASPIGKALADRHHHPRVGDLVMVPDAMRVRGETVEERADTRAKGWGYFLGEFREPVYDDATWARVADQYDGEPNPTERVFYVQYGPDPADVCRWENASVVAVPHNHEIAAQVQDDARRYL